MVETIDDFYEDGEYIGVDHTLYSGYPDEQCHDTEPVGDFNEDAIDYIGPEDGGYHSDALESEDEEMYEGVSESEDEGSLEDGQERMAVEGLLAMSQE